MNSNNFLSNLFGAVGENRKTVYLSVTPNVGLELIQLDPNMVSVKKYFCAPLRYDDAQKTIDIGEFKDAVVSLFDEADLSFHSCDVVLNMPMVLFGHKELRLFLEEDSINTALSSEVEQSYIFKRHDPILKWTDAGIQNSNENRKLFYTAIQQDLLDSISDVFSELGARLVNVGVSLISLLKALAYAKFTEEQMKDGITWNLLLLNSNSYSVVSMVGRNIVDYYEEPLAIKSLEGEEVYNAISASVQITLMSYPANYLYIVSETDLVSAEHLSSQIQVDSTIGFCENNYYKKTSIIPVDLAILQDDSYKISLEAVGIASNEELPVEFNLLGDSVTEMVDDNAPLMLPIGDDRQMVLPSRNQFKWFLYLIVFINLLLIAITFLGIPYLKGQKEAELTKLNEEIAKVTREKEATENGAASLNKFSPSREIKNTLASNRTKLIGYTALGEAVPKKLWITYFIVKDEDKFDIKGESESVEDIYTFYRNMKDSLFNVKLQIHKLESKSNSLDDIVNSSINKSSNYIFEITNMSETELNPPVKLPDGKRPNAAPPQNQSATPPQNQPAK